MRTDAAVILSLGLAVAALAESCEAAHDERFHGEPRFAFTLVLERRLGLDPDLPMRFALRWGAAETGGATREVTLDAEDDPPPLAAGDGEVSARLRLRVGDDPPADRLRHGDFGTFAIGDVIVLQGRTVVGRADRLVVFDAASAEFHLAYPAAPCDLAGPAAALVARPPEAELRAVVGRNDGLPFDARELYFDPACTDAALERLAIGDCNLALVRWGCRFGPGFEASGAAWCSDCESRVFPEGADAETCERWRVWCRALPLDPDTCDSEAALCVLGQPVRPDPCDLDCVCQKDVEACRDRGYSEPVCQANLSKCHQY